MRRHRTSQFLCAPQRWAVYVAGLHGLGVGFSAAVVSVVFLAWWTAWNLRVPLITPFISTVAVGYLRLPDDGMPPERVPAVAPSP